MATVVWLKTQVYNRSGFLPPFECYSSMEATYVIEVIDKTMETAPSSHNSKRTFGGLDGQLQDQNLE